jgi:molybdopterin converting factor small subunit
MKIVVRFFAGARQLIGQEELLLHFNENTVLKITDIIQYLDDKYKVADVLKKCSFSVNYTFCSPNNVLKDGDKVGILPPF